MKRQIVESLDRRKDSMISALWANPNYDDDKGTRQNAIEEIESHYEEAVAKIYGFDDQFEEEIDPENPFFSPVTKGLAEIEKPRNDEGTVKEVIDYSRYIDQ